MTIARARLVLSVPFIVALLLQVVAFFYLRGIDAIRATRLMPLLLSLFSVYAPPCGIIFGTIFAIKAQARRHITAEIFAVAMVACVAWNLLLLAMTGQYVLANEGDPIEFALEFTQVAGGAGFLTAAVLAGLFSRTTSS